jgi:hypothetical protein
MTNNEVKKAILEGKAEKAGMPVMVIIERKGFGIRCLDTRAKFMGTYVQCISFIENFF